MADDPKQLPLDLPEDDVTRAIRELEGEPPKPRQFNKDGLPPSEWLAALHEQVWQEHVDPDWRRSHRRFSTVFRKLTAQEWEQLQEFVREEGYLTSLHTCGFGFTCGMAVYEHPEPVYPGVPLEPKRLLFVESHHLPQEEDRFDAGWEAFSPFTHGEQNTKWLAQYKMEAPQPKGYYDY